MLPSLVSRKHFGCAKSCENTFQKLFSTIARYSNDQPTSYRNFDLKSGVLHRAATWKTGGKLKGVADKSGHGRTVFCARFARILFVLDYLLQNLATMHISLSHCQIASQATL